MAQDYSVRICRTIDGMRELVIFTGSLIFSSKLTKTMHFHQNFTKTRKFEALRGDLRRVEKKKVLWVDNAPKTLKAAIRGLLSDFVYFSIFSLDFL